MQRTLLFVLIMVWSKGSFSQADAEKIQQRISSLVVHIDSLNQIRHHGQYIDPDSLELFFLSKKDSFSYNNAQLVIIPETTTSFGIVYALLTSGKRFGYKTMVNIREDQPGSSLSRKPE